MIEPGETPTRSEIKALAETRAELGAAYEKDLLDGFADRVEAALDERLEDTEDSDGNRLALAIVSLIAATFLTLVLGLNDAVGVLILALAAIVGVNVAYAVKPRRRQRRRR